MSEFVDRLRLKAREAENNSIAAYDRGSIHTAECFAAIAAALLYCAEAWEEAMETEEV